MIIKLYIYINENTFRNIIMSYRLFRNNEKSIIIINKRPHNLKNIYKNAKKNGQIELVTALTRKCKINTFLSYKAQIYFTNVFNGFSTDVVHLNTIYKKFKITEEYGNILFHKNYPGYFINLETFLKGISIWFYIFNKFSNKMKNKKLQNIIFEILDDDRDSKLNFVEFKNISIFFPIDNIKETIFKDYSLSKYEFIQKFSFTKPAVENLKEKFNFLQKQYLELFIKIK